jgi:hypothetical protein
MIRKSTSRIGTVTDGQTRMKFFFCSSCSAMNAESRIFLAVLLALSCLGVPLHGQAPARWPYPNVDKPAAVAPGDTIEVLNIVVMRFAPDMPSPRTRFDVQYASRIAPADSAARHDEADRAAQIFGPQAIQFGAHQMMLGLCESRACAETYKPPAVFYFYEQDSTGTWRRSSPRG